ncbi:hypothetical protein HNP93_001426 [Methanococcus maripaludis]|uniref:C1A family cysteine protease n=1 Tax=Methanococcus maripaludis TaxID=39152 RepID=A0A7J9P685_METMI|nr:hypothetical protein [Methanococcus maripaludis]MBA2858725.1 hypothetical protein [Methanococcus maripaludis]
MNFFKITTCLLLLFTLISVNFAAEFLDDGQYVYCKLTNENLGEFGISGRSVSDTDNVYLVTGFSESANLPNNTYLDLSTDKYFPNVGNQGNIGSCTSWACSYYANSYLQAKIHNWDLKGNDSSKCLNPLWTYNKMNNGEIYLGANSEDTLKMLSRIGAVTYETMPENESYTFWGDEDDWLEAPQYRIKGFDFTLTSNTEVIKSWLNDGSIVIIAIPYADLRNCFENTSIISDHCQSHENATHAVVIAGYNDSMSKDNETGVFKVVNSEGPTWGPNGDGCYYMTYDAVSNLKDCYCARISGARYNTPDSKPELIGYVRFDPENKGTKDQNIIFGIGNESNISGYVDIFGSLYCNHNGGNGSMPDFIAIDLTDWKTEFDESLNATGKGYYFVNFSNGTETSVISEFGIIKYSSYPDVEEINTLNSYNCNKSVVFKFYSKTAPEIVNKSVNISDNKIQVSVTANDVEDDLWGVNVYFDGSNEYYSLNGTNETFNGSFDKSMFSYGEHYAVFEAFDGSGNANKSEMVAFEISAPSTPSKSTGNHYSSDLSDGINSGTIKRAVSNSNIVYGSEIDEGFALNLRENVENSENYELSGDTIIVGGPEANGFANKYDSEFGISITNDYPGENRGIIQVKTIEVRDGNFIKPYQVIYIAGSDRLGTQAALEYFKTLDELPKGPITIEWTENGPVLAE